MRWISKKLSLVLMLTPTVMLYTLYIVVSIGIAVYYSFTRYTGIGDPKPLGFDNYLRALGDGNFLIALKNSLILLVLSLVFLVVFGFLLACLLRVKRRGNDVCKALIFSPAVIAPIIVGIIWIFILDPQIGLVNVLLRRFGHEDWTQLWIGGKTLSPYSYAVVYIWRQLGYVATIFIAGLNMIPDEVLESAAIDGAGPFQTMTRITIPMLKETFTIVILLTITGSFKTFESVLQLTNGGPNHLSEVMVTYTYSTTFLASEYGYGMSLATLTFLITLVFSILYMAVTAKKERDV